MRLEITQEQIDKGVSCDSERCAVAIALRLIYPGKTVSVGPNSFTVNAVTFKLPKEVERFITAFDMWSSSPYNYSKPEPTVFEFDLEGAFHAEQD